MEGSGNAGFPDFEYAQQAIQYQVAAFVLKPTTEDALTEALNKACRLLEKDGSAAAVRTIWIRRSWIFRHC